MMPQKLMFRARTLRPKRCRRCEAQQKLKDGVGALMSAMFKKSWKSIEIIIIVNYTYACPVQTYHCAMYGYDAIKYERASTIASSIVLSNCGSELGCWLVIRVCISRLYIAPLNIKECYVL